MSQSSSSALSPRKAGSNAQHYVFKSSPHFNTNTSRTLLKGELSGKLLFNQERVFERLGVENVSDALVDACVASFSSNSDVQEAKRELIGLFTRTSKKSEAQLDEEVVEDENLTQGAKPTVSEQKMYKPLSTIFNHIEEFEYSNAPHKFERKWVAMGSSQLTQEGDDWSFPGVVPDFTLLDVSGESPRPTKQYYWRDRSAFCEVKPTKSQGPVPAQGAETVKKIVTQAADYARLHLSSHPFQLFSIGLLIFSSRFCVVIFDRDGATFSPDHDMWLELPVFIRVIRRLSCDLSAIELGQDPTVRIVPDAEAKKYQEIAKTLAKGADRFPIYAVTMGQGDQCWYTLGFPIWSSLSLLGRGTTIWRVCEPSKPDIRFVLKNAWRSTERLAESTIYESVRGSHPGLAEFQVGADVVFPGDKNHHISVKNLRDRDLSNEKTTVILHRLLLKTFGRPMWEYNTEIELLRGFRAAIQGHQFLFEQGILHRDISAGNVLLAVDPQEGHEGFIMDVELAHIEQPEVRSTTTTKHVVEPIRGPGGIMTPETTRTHTKFDVATSVKRGAVMSGTLQFMAYDILQGTFTCTKVEHKVWHDLESFIWVLCYCLMRRNMVPSSKKQQQQELHRFFHLHFGQSDVEVIAALRRGTGPLTITENYPWICSKEMGALLTRLSAIVHYSISVPIPEDLDQYFEAKVPMIRLSYEIFIGLLDRTLKIMENLSHS